MSQALRGMRFELSRITIQMTSPFLVGTGKSDPLHDTQFASTADGLPVLPGTSLAGVLRHAYAGEECSKTQERVTSVFGYQDGDEGAASALEISFGLVHDMNDRPVRFIGQPGIETDPVLRELKAGVIRDHVRINGRGTVDERGKFHAWMVPAGARFTFEMVLHDAGKGDTREILEELVDLLASNSLRLGGRTRRGLGEFDVVKVDHAHFDLSVPASFESFVRLPRDLSQEVPHGILHPLPFEKKEIPNLVTFKIEIEPESWWLFGGGDPTRPDHKRDSRDGAHYVDRVNAHEVRIEWRNGRGMVLGGEKSQNIAPGTGLKGALRHRVAFHSRRLNKNWATPEVDVNQGPETEEAVEELFGADSEHGKGQTGRIWISDGTIEGDQHGFLDHVSLDRFTQGARSGLLFDEAPRYGGKLVFRGILDTRNSDFIDPTCRKALVAALDDLCMGRLAFGASSSRGFGVAERGTIEWSDGGKWLEGDV